MPCVPNQDIASMISKFNRRPIREPRGAEGVAPPPPRWVPAGWESHWSRSLCVLFGKIRNQPGSWGLVGAY